MKFSDELIGAIDNFSQSAAVDMGEGGDDPECVAEAVITALEVHYREEGKELRRHFDTNPYRLVMDEVVKHVRTL